MEKSDSLTGTTLSPQITHDYRIIRLLGKGGMGEVYLAEQIGVGCRQVAVKVLSRSCSENPDIVRRFINEAASAGRINHRNVVLVYESRATSDGQLYVAMEFVRGSDLREVIEQTGALPLDRVVAITKQICAGLGAAHRLGIVHRDIKPDNIMLTRDEDGSEVVKILDFGIARLAEPDGSASRTKSGLVMGTPHYMSPEQALGNTGDKIDARSDIYSLGMVVYQMLTGRVAFQSDSWMQVIYKHINEQPVPPSQLRPELPYLSQIEDVVLKALQKDRENRQQSTARFARELDAAYARVSSAGSYETIVDDYSAPAASQQPSPGNDPFATKPGAAANAVDTSEFRMRADESPRAPVSVGKPAQPVGQPGSTAVAAQKPSALKKAIAVFAIAAVLTGGVALVIIRPWESPRKNPAALRITPGPMPPSHALYFTPVILNDKGEIVQHGRGQTQSFIEDLGSGAGLEMLSIPAGVFQMGASEADQANHPDELPRHEVSVRSFYMARFETTIGEWKAVADLPKVNRDLEMDPSAFKGDPKLPVQEVSWLDAEEFCARLSKATGRVYRLPSEAEWEYACRAGTETPFDLGDTITPDTVNYDGNYPFAAAPKQKARREPVPVGSLAAENGFGLEEMHGNVAEWCLDAWHDNYNGAPTDGGEWQAGADTRYRVYRGGSWSSGADDCRSSSREKYGPDVATSSIGFRVVMERPK